MPEVGRRLKGGLGEELGTLVALAVERTDRALAGLRAIDPGTNAEAGARKQRAMQLAGSLLDELHLLSAPGPTNVLWIEGPDSRPSLRLAPLDVASLLAEGAWPNVTAVLTSATIPPGLDHAVGLPTEPRRSPTRASRASTRRCTTSSRRSSTRQAGAPWRCSPASGPWTPRPRPCGAASTTRS
jgi:hypothetical protein